jgi:protein-S-isoprenylcysteine O-methyltransferase Ste14
MDLVRCPMRDSMKLLLKAIPITVSAIGVIVLGLFSLAGETRVLLGLPPRLGLPLALRLTGAATFVAGLGLALWLLKYRSPATMIVSTYFTFVKMFTRAPVSRPAGRTEHLVVSGPQKYVRNPPYLGATAMFFGWGLVTDSTSSLVGVAFVLLWLRLVQIPFEEKELLEIFGDQYTRYSNQVPMLIPFTKLRLR